MLFVNTISHGQVFITPLLCALSLPTASALPPILTTFKTPISALMYVPQPKTETMFASLVLNTAKIVAHQLLARSVFLDSIFVQTVTAIHFVSMAPTRILLPKLAILVLKGVLLVPRLIFAKVVFLTISSKATSQIIKDLSCVTFVI